MLFSGLIFLYVFLPGVVLLYFAAPGRLRNAVLLLASLFFYAWGEPGYLPLILVTIVLGYLAGLVIDSRGWLFLVTVTLMLVPLVYFKYADFLLGILNSVFSISIPLPHPPLPMGISFYTFQVLSYCIDRYRHRVTPQRNPVSFSAYVALFPQLVAGPIVRYSDLADELSSRQHSFSAIYEGAARFLIGLGKKVLLANTLGALCESYRASEATVLFAWLYAVAFALQIYFDFSGYSDMAIGLGRIFGFHFPENFRHPYTASSITDFWRRWHITLGSWFRDYVYIPLGGSRVSRWKWARNLLIVWALTGLWHGAGLNFLLWGLFWGVLLAMEKLLFGDSLKRHPAIGHVLVLLCVIFSFVLFNAETFAQAGSDYSAMLGGASLLSTQSLYALRKYGVILALGCLGSTPLPGLLWKKWGKRWMEPVLLVLLLILCTAELVDGSYNPFLYFRF